MRKYRNMPHSSSVYLHPKLWFNILKYLLPEELATVSMVSRRLYSIANDDRLWWPHVLEYFPLYHKRLKSRARWFGIKEEKNLTAKQIFKFSCEEDVRYHECCDSVILAIIRKDKRYEKLKDISYKELKEVRKDLPKGIHHEFEIDLMWDLVCFDRFERSAYKLIRKKLIPTPKVRGKGDHYIPKRRPRLSAIFNLAAIKNHLDILYLLRDAALTSKTLGKSLALAVRKNHLLVVEYLVNHELTRQEDKISAFKIAVGNNQLAIVHYLLEHIELDARVKGLALRWAAKKRYHEMVTYLLTMFKNIFDFLPSLKEEAWSELFKMSDFNLYVVIKRNGYGFSGESYVIIINLDDKQTARLEFKDVEQIALWLQRKCFPIQQWDNSEFHQSYHSIMGIKEYARSPAIIYCIGKIAFSDEVERNFEIKFPEINKSELGISLSGSQSLSLAFKNMQLSSELDDTPSEKQKVRRIHQRSNIYLPSKLWFKIFEYLFPEELVAVSAVSRKLYDIASDDKLWQPHVLQYFPFYQKYLEEGTIDLKTKRGESIVARKKFKSLCKGRARYYKFGNTLVLALIRKRMDCVEWLNDDFLKWEDDSHIELNIIESDLFKLARKELISRLNLPKKKNPYFRAKKMTLSDAFILSVSKRDLGILGLLTKAAPISKILGKPLMIATRVDRLSAVKYLINYQLIKQEDKLSAFKIAVGRNRLDIVKYLFDKVELDTVIKGRALRWAEKKRYHKIVKFLLTKFKNIFDFLPSLKEGAWEKLFKMPDFNLYIAIKTNGYDFSSESYIVFINLDNEQTVELAFEDMKKIALWLQRKCLPIEQEDNVSYQYYHWIMGDEQHERAPAVIYCIGKIAFSNEVKNHFEIKFPKIDSPELSISLNSTKSLTFAFNNMQLSVKPDDAPSEKQQVLKICQNTSN